MAHFAPAGQNAFGSIDIRRGGDLDSANGKGCTVAPYYADGNCTIYNANCDDVLPALGRFDLLLTEAPKYPPGLSDDNKARMDSGLKVAAQSNRIGALPEAGLQLAIEICDNAIVWRPDRYKLPIGRKLEWFCNNHQFSAAWHNIAAPRIMSWAPVRQFDRLRLFKQCIHFTPQANTILDPFMDTGDVLIAAISLRKNFVGIELDRVRCEHALNRLLELRKTRS